MEKVGLPFIPTTGHTGEKEREGACGEVRVSVRMIMLKKACSVGVPTMKVSERERVCMGLCLR